MRTTAPAFSFYLAALTLCVFPVAAGGAGIDGISVCHGFGCKFKESISVSAAEWEQVTMFFREPAETPEQEREQIKKAAGWFEVVAGRYTPIHLDRGRNKRLKEPVRLKDGTTVNGDSTVGQMDCIDESLNMTTYLTLMDQAGLFRHHRTVERARRRSAYDQHYAGQIEELETGTRWVVDSWFYDYGTLPYLEEATEWLDIPFLFSTSFPESED